jgi:hypothetical protein
MFERQRLITIASHILLSFVTYWVLPRRLHRVPIAARPRYPELRRDTYGFH